MHVFTRPNKGEKAAWKNGLTKRQSKPFKELAKETFKFTSKDVMWIIVCILTLGLAKIAWLIGDFMVGILGLEGTKGNRTILKSLWEELEKLVNK